MVLVEVMSSSNGMPREPPPALNPLRAGNYIENGREYHGYLKGLYMYPCDELEMDRMDIFHKFFLVARREQLHSAPLVPNYDGPRIMDLGCGTGIWAIDMADKYPEAEVIGWDISMIQPMRIPANLSFKQRNFESPWHGTAMDSWDMIHMRMLAGSVGDWNDLYAKAFRHLKPNFGHLEHIEMDVRPRCDDGSLPSHSALNDWWRLLSLATEQACKPLTLPDTKARLQSLGFVDITEQIIKVPFNPWPADPHQKDIGRWYNLGLNQYLEAVSLGPLTRVMGWRKADVDKLVEETRRELNSKKFHIYCNMHIWTARRPQNETY